MAIAELYSGSATISTTEISLVSGTSSLQSDATDGIYQVFLDLNALANGDVFELKVKEKVRSADTQRVTHIIPPALLSGIAFGEPGAYTPQEPTQYYATPNVPIHAAISRASMVCHASGPCVPRNTTSSPGAQTPPATCPA